MTFKKWAWDIFETTGNLEAFLAMKEAENQERQKVFGKMEIGNIELGDIDLMKKNMNGETDGTNQN